VAYVFFVHLVFVCIKYVLYRICFVSALILLYVLGQYAELSEYTLKQYAGLAWWN